MQVSGITSGATAIDASITSSCAIVSGAEKCWGSNQSGKLGNGTTVGFSTTPVQVTGLTSGVTALETGFEHSCALVNGAAKCWGDNFYGQLGTGLTGTDSGTPVQVTGILSGATALGVGNYHACAVVSAVAKCWGNNSFGSLGNGATTHSSSPVQVSGLTSGTTALSSGGIQTCAIANGAAKCWGYNSSAQLGDGTLTTRTTPVDVAGLTSGVTAVSAGGNHSCGIVNGAGKCWGSNSLAAVSWTDNATNEDGYRIYRYNAGTYVLETTTAANATTATFTNAAMNTANAQIFVVAAFNASGETYADTHIFSLARSSPTGVLSAPTYAVPTNVTGTTATVNWTDTATNETGYLVYRVLGATQTLVPCSTSTANLTTCTDTGLTPGTFFQYHVYAWNSSGTGYPGTGVIVHTPKPLAAPTITSATGTSPTQIRLNWIDNASDETGYAVYQYNAGTYSAVALTGPNTSTVVLNGLTPDTLNVYIVAATRGFDVSYAPYGIWATTTT